MDYSRLIHIIDSSELSDLDQQYLDALSEKDEDKMRSLVAKAWKRAYGNRGGFDKVFYKGASEGNVVAGYFSDDYEFPAHYGFSEPRKFFLAMENRFEYDFHYSGSDGDYEGEDGEIRSTYGVMKNADKEASEAGLPPYDGYILYNVGEGVAFGMHDCDDYIVNDPHNVKSADLVTYDDAGKIIPLSQRFNPESADCRY